MNTGGSEKARATGSVRPDPLLAVLAVIDRGVFDELEHPDAFTRGWNASRRDVGRAIHAMRITAGLRELRDAMPTVTEAVSVREYDGPYSSEGG